MQELEIARALEADILTNIGMRSWCGCTKFVLCPFPNSSLYYATICSHDEAAIMFHDDQYFFERTHWWYDASLKWMVSRRRFEEMHFDALWEEPTEDWDEYNKYVRTHVGTKFFFIRDDGRVRNMLERAWVEPVWK